jgi:polyhydroxyalkanoate synthase
MRPGRCKRPLRQACSRRMGALANAGMQTPGFEYRRCERHAGPSHLFQFDPAKLQELQQRYIADASALWNQGLQEGTDSGRVL